MTRSKRTAFTLVEMLVVIAIIGILVGLLLPAIGMVRERALVTRMAVEIKNFGLGVESYKQKQGDYPPDFSGALLVRRHILKVWPQIDPAELNRVSMVFWGTTSPVQNSPSRVDPAEALVFWLDGFSSDPQRPFTGRGGPFLVNGAGVITAYNRDRLEGAFNFDKGRLNWGDDSDFFPVYGPQTKNRAPYVYFDSRTYGGLGLANQAPINGFYPLLPTSPFAWARPYLSARTRAVSPSFPYGREWTNDDTFQIICAGLDDNYGGPVQFLAAPATVRPYPVFPTGINYTTPGTGDDDNITNFSGGKALKDQKP